MAEIKTTRGSAMPTPQKPLSTPSLSAALVAAHNMIKNPPVAPKKGPIRVMATQAGWYGNTRKKEGDIFQIEGRHKLSKIWMKEI